MYMRVVKQVKGMVDYFGETRKSMQDFKVYNQKILHAPSSPRSKATPPKHMNVHGLIIGGSRVHQSYCHICTNLSLSMVRKKLYIVIAIVNNKHGYFYNLQLSTSSVTIAICPQYVRLAFSAAPAH